MITLNVEIEFTEDILGTASANPEVHEEFIASKSADADKIEEELKALHADELIEKAITIFPKDDNGNPFLFDYQIKGFFKETTGILLELESEIKVGKSKLSKYTHKRIIDNYLFIKPRMVPFVLSGKGGRCTRPLRAETMKGERVALATSETVPAGSKIEFRIEILHDSLADIIEKCLDYGELKGIGQWRNSGKGRFRVLKCETVKTEKFDS